MLLEICFRWTGEGVQHSGQQQQQQQQQQLKEGEGSKYNFGQLPPPALRKSAENYPRSSPP